MGALKIFESPWLLFQKLLMFFCSDRCYMNVRTKFKFVALPIPEITGGIQQIWAVAGYAHGPHSLSLKFLMGFCLDGE